MQFINKKKIERQMEKNILIKSYIIRYLTWKIFSRQVTQNIFLSPGKRVPFPFLLFRFHVNTIRLSLLPRRSAPWPSVCARRGRKRNYLITWLDIFASILSATYIDPRTVKELYNGEFNKGAVSQVDWYCLCLVNLSGPVAEKVHLLNRCRFSTFRQQKNPSPRLCFPEYRAFPLACACIWKSSPAINNRRPLFHRGGNGGGEECVLSRHIVLFNERKVKKRTPYQCAHFEESCWRKNERRKRNWFKVIIFKIFFSFPSLPFLSLFANYIARYGLLTNREERKRLGRVRLQGDVYISRDWA